MGTHISDYLSKKSNPTVTPTVADQEGIVHGSLRTDTRGAGESFSTSAMSMKP